MALPTPNSPRSFLRSPPLRAVPHRQHINLAFLAVRRYGMPAATGKICTWIRQIAAYERAPQKYHYTVSRAWVEIVAHHLGTGPECADFDIFAARIPHC